MKCRFEFRKRLQRGIRTGTFIARKRRFPTYRLALMHDSFLHLHGNDLALEFALILRAQSVLMTAQCEGILIFTSDPVPALQLLGRESHAHVHFRPVIDQRGIRSEMLPTHRNKTHRFRATRENDLRAPRANAIRSHRDRL